MFCAFLSQRTFQMDEKVAWGLIKIKPEVLEGQTNDEWHALNGKQGDGKEGMVQIIMQYKVCYYLCSYLWWCITRLFHCVCTFFALTLLSPSNIEGILLIPR